MAIAETDLHFNMSIGRTTNLCVVIDQFDDGSIIMRVGILVSHAHVAI